VQILLATDADWLVDDVVAALGGDGITFVVVRDGRRVSEQVGGAPEEAPIDLVIADLQIGTMGGMAVTMSLRLDDSAGLVPRVPVLMLLDRAADLHLARRSGADGWLIKPLNPLRLRRATDALLDGRTYHEGLPKIVESPIDPAEPAEAVDLDNPSDPTDDAGTPPSPHEPAEEEPAPAG
jgi:DNA-binding response OmpR family regulator